MNTVVFHTLWGMGARNLPVPRPAVPTPGYLRPSVTRSRGHAQGGACHLRQPGRHREAICDVPSGGAAAEAARSHWSMVDPSPTPPARDNGPEHQVKTPGVSTCKN